MGKQRKRERQKNSKEYRNTETTTAKKQQFPTSTISFLPLSECNLSGLQYSEIIPFSLALINKYEQNKLNTVTGYIKFNFLLRSCFVLFFLIKVHLNTSLAQPWKNICVFTKFRVSNPVFGFSRVLNVSLTIKGLALAKILNLFLYYFCFCWRKVWG